MYILIIWMRVFGIRDRKHYLLYFERRFAGSKSRPAQTPVNNG